MAGLTGKRGEGGVVRFPPFNSSHTFLDCEVRIASCAIQNV